MVPLGRRSICSSCLPLDALVRSGAGVGLLLLLLLLLLRSGLYPRGAPLAGVHELAGDGSDVRQLHPVLLVPRLPVLLRELDRKELCGEEDCPVGDVLGRVLQEERRLEAVVDEVPRDLREELEGLGVEGLEAEGALRDVLVGLVDPEVEAEGVEEGALGDEDVLAEGVEDLGVVAEDVPHGREVHVVADAVARLKHLVHPPHALLHLAG